SDVRAEAPTGGAFGSGGLSRGRRRRHGVVRRLGQRGERPDRERAEHDEHSVHDPLWPPMRRTTPCPMGRLVVSKVAERNVSAGMVTRGETGSSEHMAGRMRATKDVGEPPLMYHEGLRIAIRFLRPAQSLGVLLNPRARWARAWTCWDRA